MMRQHAMFLLPPPVFLFLSLASSSPPFISSPLPLLPPSSFHSPLSLLLFFWYLFLKVCVCTRMQHAHSQSYIQWNNMSHYRSRPAGSFVIKLFVFVCCSAHIHTSLFRIFSLTPAHRVMFVFLFFFFLFLFLPSFAHSHVKNCTAQSHSLSLE